MLYKLKRRWKGGSTHVVLDPITLIEPAQRVAVTPGSVPAKQAPATLRQQRLAALVPRPRLHLTTYHGVFAPAASFRDRVVPEPERDDGTDTDIQCQHVAPTF